MRVNMLMIKKYIAEMEEGVNEVVAANRLFVMDILSLEEAGWCDDIYKAARNDLLCLQEETNAFIMRLEGLMIALADEYCRWKEKYAGEEHVRPSIDIGRVDVLDAAVAENSEDYQMTIPVITQYIESTKGYLAAIETQLGAMKERHMKFYEYYETPRYDSLTKRLGEQYAVIEEILASMKATNAVIEEKKGEIWELVNTDYE